jgi:Domain of unknown function (DUF4276)
MRTFGLIVEGIYDEAVLIEFIRKCGSSDVEVISRVCGPKGSLMNRFPGFLEEFRYVKHGSHVDKALVVRDADGKVPATLIEAMEARIARRTYPFPVRCLVIVQELETWLLADSEALAKVTQEYASRAVAEINEPLERIVDPKGRLQRLLSGAKVPYTQEVARKIARAIRLEIIEERCLNFRSFRQAVADL